MNNNNSVCVSIPCCQDNSCSDTGVKDAPEVEVDGGCHGEGHEADDGDPGERSEDGGQVVSWRLLWRPAGVCVEAVVVSVPVVAV